MRTQFTWFESFTRAAQRIKNKQHRCTFYDIVAEYALYEKEPSMDSLPDSVAIAFELIKPNLDSSKRKAESGKAGGNSKQTASKTEANSKQTASEKEGEKEIEKEKEKEKEIEGEDECLKKADVSAVVSAYANKINANPGERTIAEIKGFVQAMGAECCLRAIDIALDERKATWSYIRGILRSKLEQGVHSLADWDALEEKRQNQLDAKRKGFVPISNGPQPEDDSKDMMRMVRLLEMMERDEDDGES